MYGPMDVWMYGCIGVWMYGSVGVCMHVRVCCMCICFGVCLEMQILLLYIDGVCMYLRICMYAYIF
jgi:hypothetical protein